MFRNWLRFLNTRDNRRPASGRRRSAVQPRLERLEDRALMNAGGLDPTFGIGGKTVIAFDKGGALSDQAQAVAIDAQGRTIVVGSAQLGATDRDFAVTRLNPDGSLDTTFANGGTKTIAFDLGGGHDDEATSVTIDSTGRIIVAGFAERDNVVGVKDYDFALVRLFSDGRLDPTFHHTGQMTLAINGGTGLPDKAYAVAMNSSDQIIVAGSTQFGATDTDFVVVRLNPHGNPDPFFGANGMNILNFDKGGAKQDVAKAIAIDGQGRIVLAGYAQFSTTDFDFAVTRLTADGKVDNTFGKRTIAFDKGAGLEDKATAVAIDDKGRIVLAGSAQFSDTDFDFALARLDVNGNLDASFDGDGKQTVAFDLGGGNEDRATSVLIQSDGKILAGGFAHRALGADIDFAMARLNSDGTLDSTFDGDGRATVAFDLGGGLTDGAFGAALTPDGSKVVLVGTVDRGGGNTDFGVARLDTGLKPHPHALVAPAPGAAIHRGMGHDQTLPLAMSNRDADSPGAVQIDFLPSSPHDKKKLRLFSF
jgi:uncharacterized delta-60 repeat protein